MKTDFVEVKNSKINGKGAFAKKNFKKGEIVVNWDLSKKLEKIEIDKMTPEEKKYVCFFDGEYIVMQEPENCINHSCDPNTESKNFCDVAIRDIKKGEEITADYSSVASGGPKIRCNCGSSNCRGVIET